MKHRDTEAQSFFRSCFEFLQKVFLGLMCSFSCVLWAIFWSFSLLFSAPQLSIVHYQLILRISVPLCSMKDSHGFFTFNF